ncbi:hypothetical protein CRUP_003789, partial [Coryphaenoides rupestris]
VSSSSSTLSLLFGKRSFSSGLVILRAVGGRGGQHHGHAVVLQRQHRDRTLAPVQQQGHTVDIGALRKHRRHVCKWRRERRDAVS